MTRRRCDCPSCQADRWANLLALFILAVVVVFGLGVLGWLPW
jgi:hypothetical protein